MIKIIYISVLLSYSLLMATITQEECQVPKILLETIKLTENETKYPYWIRTNDLSTKNKFKNILKNYNHKINKDEMLIDCLDFTNCINITNALIKNQITNLDLGLFQINYVSYPFSLHTYFDERLSYKRACEVVKEKIKLNKNKWSWEVLASYHSLTPDLNRKYKKKLIKNYIKLIKEGNEKSITSLEKSVSEDLLTISN